MSKELTENALKNEEYNKSYSPEKKKNSIDIDKTIK